MAWRRLTEGDLAAYLSQREVEAYRRSADYTADAVASILAATGHLVRAHVRSGGVRVSPASEPAIPEALVPPALDYAAFDLLKRFRLPVPEDRREARRQAIDLFAHVAERKLAVEPDGEGEEAGASPSTAPATGRANPEKRLLD